MRRLFEAELTRRARASVSSSRRERGRFMSEPVIETIGLKKSYKTVEAVCGIGPQCSSRLDLRFPGAKRRGQDDDYKDVAGDGRARRGRRARAGHPIEPRSESLEIRRRTGFVSEDKGLYDYMTVGQMIEFTRPFFPSWRRDRASELLGSFELPLTRKVRQLSKGMRTKLALLLALARGAELLVLDEPTEGLDPAAIEEVLQVLVRLVAADESDDLFFIPSDRRSRADSRSHRNHPSRPRGGRGRAR